MAGICSLNLVSKQSVWKSLMNSACSTVGDFESIIHNKLNSIGLSSNKTNINKIGAIILRECIIDKLNILRKRGTNRQLIKQRIQYYNSDDFIDRFTDSMPIKTGNTRTKYASYFDLLFNVVSKSDDDDNDGWRNRFNQYSDQEQCMRAKRVDKNRFKTVPEFQNNPTPTICYLCNRSILPKGTNGQKTMECEHILPVSSALSHWWLIKSNTEQSLTDTQLSELSNEYGWSHRCCNQIKTNSEFIIYDSRLDKYVFNRNLVETMLNEINISTKYDCSVANNSQGTIDVDTQLINIQGTIQPLLDKINANLNATDSHDMYELICKFKIISSMSAESFEGVIANTSDAYNTTKLNAERAKKSKKTQLANKTRRLQEEAEEDEEKRKTREASNQRRQNSVLIRDALKEGTKRRGEITKTRQKQSRSKTRQNKITQSDIQQQLSEIAEGTSEDTMNISPSIVGGASTIQPIETSGDDNLDVLLNIIGSGIDENIISDIEEKFDDVIKSYKYTVFRENEYGEINKHKFWIYLDENTEEQMRSARGAEERHAQYRLNLGRGVNKKRLQGIKNKKTRKKTNKRKKKRNEQNKRKKTKQQRIKK